MNLLPQIDLNTVMPVLGLAAIAIVVIVALLLRTVLHSRLALLIAIVLGVIIAGPALGGILAAIVNTLAVMLVIVSLAVIAVLLIIRSHPDLLTLAHNALLLLPRQPMPSAPPNMLPARTETPPDSIALVEPSRRKIARRTGGDEWGF